MITIREINLDNLREATKLKVANNQTEFVADNTQSIAWSRYLPNLIPQGIYNDDTMVGFALYGSWGDEKPGFWGIARFMIGEQYQGNGYGKAAMREIIRLIKEQDHQASGITLSYVPTNDIARKLYASVGFVETGELWGDEVEAIFAYPPEDMAETAAPVKKLQTVTIHELTIDNWRETIKLDLNESQRGFVAPNVHSLALSRFLPERIPAGIYSDGRMVGFVFYGERAPQTWNIMRFMIDRNYQGQGYGKAAMLEIIRDIRERAPDCHLINLSFAPENDVARKLYADVGFKETGDFDEDEVIAELELHPMHN